MRERSITLYFLQGSADKVYTVRLTNTQTELDGWLVSFSYGRRGKPAKTGLKTNRPVPYAVAKVIFDKLIAAKQLKGYTLGIDVAAYTDNPNMGTQTEFIPQLANPVNKQQLSTIYNKNIYNIALQIKHDGERRGCLLDKIIRTTNRRGQETTVTEEITEALKFLQLSLPRLTSKGTSVILDTEDMGDHLIIFDCKFGIENLPFYQRQTQLILLAQLLTSHPALKVDIPFWPQSEAKMWAFIDRCKKDNEEGVIIRIGDSVYTPGRPNSLGDLLKFKFIESATVQVLGLTIGKRSVPIGVIAGSGKLLLMGKVTIPPNYKIPEIGDLVEIEYLYVHPGEGGCFSMPQYKGPRSDKAIADAHLTLKFKK